VGGELINGAAANLLIGAWSARGRSHPLGTEDVAISLKEAARPVPIRKIKFRGPQSGCQCGARKWYGARAKRIGGFCLRSLRWEAAAGPWLVGIFVDNLRKPARGFLAPLLSAHHDLHCREPAPANVASEVSQSVSTPSPSERSPASGLLLVVVITLAVVVATRRTFACSSPVCASCRATWWTAGARDSLQLLRLQNDLNTVALAMRDMLDAGEPYPWSHGPRNSTAVRADLDSAAPARRAVCRSASHSRPARRI